MPLGQPRRIFNRSSRRPWGRWLLVALACAGLAAVAGEGEVLLSGLFAARAPAVRAENVAVVDGETLRVAGQVVRLDGVIAPRQGADCGNGTDCGGRAALQLASLVRNQTVACRLDAGSGGGQSLARCKIGGTDISEAVVASGWAQAARPELKAAEAQARAAHLGLWAYR